VCRGLMGFYLVLRDWAAQVTAEHSNDFCNLKSNTIPVHLFRLPYRIVFSTRPLLTLTTHILIAAVTRLDVSLRFVSSSFSLSYGVVYNVRALFV
jgi:hypothetical protein